MDEAWAGVMSEHTSTAPLLEPALVVPDVADADVEPLDAVAVAVELAVAAPPADDPVDATVLAVSPGAVFDALEQALTDSDKAASPPNTSNAVARITHLRVLVPADPPGPIRRKSAGRNGGVTRALSAAGHTSLERAGRSVNGHDNPLRDQLSAPLARSNSVATTRRSCTPAASSEASHTIGGPMTAGS